MLASDGGVVGSTRSGLAVIQQLAFGCPGRIQQAAKDNIRLVSAITPWEIALRGSQGRRALDRDMGE